MALDKQATAKAEEFHRLAQKLKDLKLKIKAMENPDISALNADLLARTKEVEVSQARIEVFSLILTIRSYQIN
jgi:hypothetical protein